MKKVNPALSSVEVVLGLEDRGAIVSDYVETERRHYIVRIDSQGQHVNKLYDTDKLVTGFILLNPDELLILQKEGIIARVQISDGKTIDTFKVDVGHLADGILDDHENLLLVDLNRMEVFNYCMTTKHKKVIVQKDKKRLNNPCSIHKAQSDKRVLYLVCFEYCVNIYNSEWCFQGSLGSGLKGSENLDLRYPSSAIFTPYRTVWVTDSDSDAVKEFSLNNCFLRYIIRGKCHPKKLSLCAGQLWLPYREEQYVGAKCNINCYQLIQGVRFE